MQTFLIIVGCIIGAVVLACVWGYYKLKSLAARGLVFVAQKQVEGLTESVKADFVTPDLRDQLAALKVRVDNLPAPGFFNSTEVLGLAAALIAELAKLDEAVKAANPANAASPNAPVVVIDGEIVENRPGVLVIEGSVVENAPLALPPANTTDSSGANPGVVTDQPKDGTGNG